jgi:hypothetical protein
MDSIGALDFWVLPRRGPAIHQHARGLSAFYTLGYDNDDPTIVRFVAPLRFTAITIFPRYWTTRPVTIASPIVHIAAGATLYGVRRFPGSSKDECEALMGFGQTESDRTPHVFSGEKLGSYGPDLQIGPFWFPCDALGGAPQGDLPMLEVPGFDDSSGWGADDAESARLILAPRRDEDGSSRYEAVDFDLRSEPHDPSGNLRKGVRIFGNAAGAVLLANAQVKLIERHGENMKVRLVLGRPFSSQNELWMEGWVPPGAFKVLGGSWIPHLPNGGYYGGGHRSSPPPPFCLGPLEPGTPIVSPNGDTWATVAERVEGVFLRGTPRHRLVNFLGEYKNAFCTARELGYSPRERFRSCLADAEVRPSDVKLQCPDPSP